MTDPLLTTLRELAEPAPDTLTDGVIDQWSRAPSRLGEALVVTGRHGVRLVRTLDWVGDVETFLADYRERHARPVRAGREAPEELRRALDGTGPVPAFEDLDLDELTPFTRDVLAATATIPAGRVEPYGWVAREIGRPKAVRAVGTALARNPVPLLVPCHRVTRGDGHLGQYLFGTPRKAALLRAEGVDVDALGA